MKDMVAANNKIRANKSSNYSFILSHNESPSSSSSSFAPYYSNLFSASESDRPFVKSTVI